MRIRIKAFGRAKEIMDSSIVEIEVKDDLNTEELKEWLNEKYPRLRLLRSYMIALNNEYVREPKIIQTIDEIAIIPPVSGG